MTFKVEFRNGTCVEWDRTADGVSRTENERYTPSLYIDGPETPLADLRTALERDPKVTATAIERWYTSLQDTAKTDVLRVDVDHVADVRSVATEVRGVHERDSYAPGTFRLYNVDLSPQFRYCVETGTDPTPDHALSTLSLRIGDQALATKDVSSLTVDGDEITGSPAAVLQAVYNRVRTTDPDVLIVSHGDLVPVLYEQADEVGLSEFQLGRETGWDKLAGESTYVSYGQVGHSPARYDVPGRVLLNTSNSFLWAETSLNGLVDLVSRSWKPLQELGWASIGTVLTAIQIREALERDVLIPWDKWEPEEFKDVRTLHAADRGGFTFAPQVGLHENVYEVDFSSLYPRIICEWNISPDTIRCDCHSDRTDIPELGYNVCDDDGFLPAVLQPLLDDRAAIKQQLRETDDPEREAELNSRSAAIKWILVSCFGYQGYRNAKFGRIECHEAINAVARDILLRSKERLEANGWEIVHGIVDSLWVTPMDNTETTPLSSVTDAISDDIGITLERESRYDWVCFVPKRTSNAGALTKYFGKVADTDEYKLRGIEARQRSTPPYIEAVQRDLIRIVETERNPEAVCDRLQRSLTELRAGDVPPEELVITKRASKAPEAYTQRTQTVAALERARMKGLDPQPGESLQYVVVNDDTRSRDRVRLQFEDISEYDTGFYRGQLVRAAESIVSPFGWDAERIETYLNDIDDVSLAAF
ncbi:type B DNA-directed DNA polymerase [Halostella litorea]|uniref:type B DNA-directed DNA polymerase n=1 Tax=Halostella litorea TaxID=2528831 RepID=UPI001092B3C5|nr:type B DNA-directed DNA polymerase [Halostella litorea]